MIRETSRMSSTSTKPMFMKSSITQKQTGRIIPFQSAKIVKNPESRYLYFSNCGIARLAMKSLNLPSSLGQMSSTCSVSTMA